LSNLLWNLLLALAWTAMNGEFTAANFLTGFALGFLVLFFARRAVGSQSYVGKVWQAASLLLFFMWELVKANLRVAFDVLTPRHRMRPGLIAVPLDAQTDAEITLLANLVSLTPGTLSLDVSSDRRVLYIHAMYIDEDLETERRKIKQGFERRILEVMR
jgi:multicomponent Na+:H+ antiporter subunit E